MVEIVHSPVEVAPTPASWTVYNPPTSLSYDGYDGGGDGGFNLGSSTHNQVSPTAGNTNNVQVGSDHSMRTDYYDHIFIVPSRFDLDNPALNTPFEFSVWNAYMESNTLNAVVETGTSGLTETITLGAYFGGEFRENQSIEVTPAAPNNITATYEFQFTNGSAVLIFNALQSIVFDYEPEVPLVHTIEYVTDVMKSYNGSEQRQSVRRNPRRSYKFDSIIETEKRIRDLRELYLFKRATLLESPIWEEPFYTTVAITPGTNTIDGDFSLSDIQPEDNIWILGGGSNEFVKVQSITASQIVTSNNIETAFPIGSAVYQTKKVVSLKDPRFTRGNFAGAQAKLDLTVEDHRDLYGTSGNVLTYNAKPLLPDRAIGSSFDESFDNQEDVIDYVNKFRYEVRQAVSDSVQQRRYKIRNRQQYQDWKAFMQTVAGSRGTFYAPTWREDFVVVTPPVQNASTFRVDETLINYELDWSSSKAHKHLLIIAASGIVYKEILSAGSNGDGTQTLTVTPAFGATAADVDISFVCFLEQLRVEGDKFTIENNHLESTIEFKVRTVQQDD